MLEDLTPDTIRHVEDAARAARRLVLQAVRHAGAGHVGGPLSQADILALLYSQELRVDPRRPDWADRDRFVLSKGHGAIGLYAILALRGYFPVGELTTFDRLDSRLQCHPDSTRLPGLDFSTGSLGQGLSAGVGMALGARVLGKDFRTYVLLGDGECQEGQIWEAAQVAARYGVDNLVTILDCNGLQQYGWPSGAGHPAAYPEPLPEPAARFAAFGWQVFEADGHDLVGLHGAIRRARLVRGKPSLVVARTIKGKGVSFIENNPAWHSKVPSDAELERALVELGGDASIFPAASWGYVAESPVHRPVQGPSEATPLTGGPRQSMRDAFGDALVSLGDADSRVVVLDADLANSTRTDKFAVAHPERFFQLGIGEQNMVTLAAGMASVGLIPFASTFTPFLLHRALDSISVAVAQSGHPVKLVGCYSGITTSRTGKSHQSVGDLAISRSMPGLAVIAPADDREAAQAIAAAANHPIPVYLRMARDGEQAVFDADYQFEIGRCVVLSRGTDLALISTGVQTARAVEAVRTLNARGLTVQHVHVPTLKPLDTEAIVDAARRTGLVVTAEEHSVLGGLGGAVCEVLAERCPVPVKRIGLADVYTESASDAELLDKYGLTPARIASAALEWHRDHRERLELAGPQAAHPFAGTLQAPAP